GRLEDAFRKTEAVRNRPSLVVTASRGQGNWVKVPWIAFLDTRETATPQKGVYCVYLFRKDMTGVYLTLNQGVMEPFKRLKSAGATTFLKENARRIREEFPELRSLGLAVDDDIDLRVERGLGARYKVSTIAYKFYETGNVPGDETLLADLANLVGLYERYVERKVPVSALGSS